MDLEQCNCYWSKHQEEYMGEMINLKRHDRIARYSEIKQNNQVRKLWIGTGTSSGLPYPRTSSGPHPTKYQDKISTVTKFSSISSGSLSGYTFFSLKECQPKDFTGSLLELGIEYFSTCCLRLNTLMSASLCIFKSGDSCNLVVD
ncbi:hypothetical protein BDB01DRAFT_831893 [Pilobolus umbonatus]|nr:hypothetical protein BDB01DRAFT_831893 [Pilobolus umbonatus]